MEKKKVSLIDRGHFKVTGKIGPNQIDNTSSWVKIENKYSLNKYWGHSENPNLLNLKDLINFILLIINELRFTKFEKFSKSV